MENRISTTVSITKHDLYTPEQVDLLKNTLWGTPGETQYRHLDTEKTIRHIKSPEFYTLTRNGTLMCTVCLSGRRINLDSTMVKSSYVCYLAANAAINGKGKRKCKKGEPGKKGVIKTFMEHVFQRNNEANTSQQVPKSLLYAYVESDNEQSLHLCYSFGFRSVRKLTTVPFSRFSPRNFDGIRKARVDEYDSIRKAVFDQYEGYNFVCLDYLFFEGNYFVAEADGKIVAGVQSNPIGWSFKNLPGVSGKILLKMLPHIPYLRRLINPKTFLFSAYEGIFCLPGYEKKLDELFESVLFYQKRNTALIWLDIQSSLHSYLRQNCKLGLMDILNSNGQGEIMVKSESLTECDWENLLGNPMYISSFDMN